jgi:hypothetical protein
MMPKLKTIAADLITGTPTLPFISFSFDKTTKLMIHQEEAQTVESTPAGRFSWWNCFL